MTNRGAVLRGALIVAIAMGTYAMGVHVWDWRARLGLLLAGLIAMRGFVDTSWGDRPQAQPNRNLTP